MFGFSQTVGGNLKMRTISLIAFLLTTTLAYSQSRLWLGGNRYWIGSEVCELLCVHHSDNGTKLKFNIEELDTISGRIDSIFHSCSDYFNYSFKSYDKDGKPVIIGFFHMHDSYISMPMSYEEEELFLKEKPEQLDVHVLYYGENFEGRLRRPETSRCGYNWTTIKKQDSGILWGSQSGYLYNSADWRRMPGR